MQPRSSPCFLSEQKQAATRRVEGLGGRGRSRAPADQRFDAASRVVGRVGRRCDVDPSRVRRLGAAPQPAMVRSCRRAEGGDRVPHAERPFVREHAGRRGVGAEERAERYERAQAALPRSLHELGIEAAEAVEVVAARRARPPRRRTGRRADRSPPARPPGAGETGRPRPRTARRARARRRSRAADVPPSYALRSRAPRRGSPGAAP